MDMARHCIFNILSGYMTGTYRFKTGFYSITDIPTEVQKAIDYTLMGVHNTFCFLYDILIVSKGTNDDLLNLVHLLLVQS